MNKVGLVLEGGGMRGAYTGGVLDAFMELGIVFHNCYGVSAGVGNALSYVSHQPKRNYSLYTKLAQDKRYLSLSNFFKTGSLFGMKFVFFDVPKKHLYFDYSTYKKSKIKLTIVATNVSTGKPFYKQLKDAKKEMIYACASAAIPLASPIIKVDGYKLLDGGASDSIPIEYSKACGNTKNIIVLTRNKGFVAKKSKVAFVFYLRYLPYQQFAKTAAHRYYYYNQSVTFSQKEEDDGNAIIIRPQKALEVGRFEKDPQKLGALYMDGYNDVMTIKNELLEFIKNCDNVEIITP